MQNQLQRAINLIKKTGDKLLVADKSENVYAVMNLDEYEEMVVNRSEVRGLTENELLDKINRDIAIWKSDIIDPEIDFGEDEISEQLPVWEEQIKDRDYESVDEIMKEKPYIAPKKRKQWSIPSDRKEGAEEVIEEDRQYLEEVPF